MADIIQFPTKPEPKLIPHDVQAIKGYMGKLHENADRDQVWVGAAVSTTIDMLEGDPELVMETAVRLMQIVDNLDN